MLKLLKIIAIVMVLMSATAFAAAANAVLGASEFLTEAQKSYGRHDYKQALMLFHQAADLGSPDAQYMTALMIYRGEGGIVSDPAEAARYYTLAANNNLPKAQYNLAVLYYQGAGVDRNDVEAYKWLYLATLKGEPRAMDMLPVADRNLAADQKAQAISEAHSFQIVGNS